MNILTYPQVSLCLGTFYCDKGNYDRIAFSDFSWLGLDPSNGRPHLSPIPSTSSIVVGPNKAAEETGEASKTALASEVLGDSFSASPPPVKNIPNYPEGFPANFKRVKGQRAFSESEAQNVGHRLPLILQAMHG